MRTREKVVVEEDYYVEAFTGLQDRFPLLCQAEGRPDVCGAIRISDEAGNVVVGAVAYQDTVRSTALLSKFAERFAQYSGPADCSDPNGYRKRLGIDLPLSRAISGEFQQLSTADEGHFSGLLPLRRHGGERYCVPYEHRSS